MKKNIKEYIHIKDSLNQSFIIHIDDEYNLVFNQLNENNNLTDRKIIEKKVVDFSANIDKKDRIHLIYLLSNGELTYSIYLDKQWQKNLVRKLDIKSNIYKNFNLFLHEDYVNIFYAFANIININLWTIEHIAKDSNHWRKCTVTNIFTERELAPFYIDKDKFGNIFLVYTAKEYNTNHIYYTTYNIFINEWRKTLTKISYSETDNVFPYLFIDSRDNIHILWYSLENNNYLIKYKQLSSMGKEKYHWKEIKLFKIILSKYPPLMLEKNNELKILCASNDGIHSLISKNYGLNWSVEDNIQLNDSEVHLIKYSHNAPLSSNYNKINHLYGTVEDDKVHYFFTEDLDKKPITDKISTSDLKDDVQEKVVLVKENEQESDKNQIEENSKILKEVIDSITDIKKDLELIREYIQKIEEKQKPRKGFFK